MYKGPLLLRNRPNKWGKCWGSVNRNKWQWHCNLLQQSPNTTFFYVFIARFSIVVKFRKCWCNYFSFLVMVSLGFNIGWVVYLVSNLFGFGFTTLKVIPLKLFYYQTFFETWRDEHSWYEHFKNAIKNWGHRAFLRVSRPLKWGIFSGCAWKVRITFIQN